MMVRGRYWICEYADTCTKDNDDPTDIYAPCTCKELRFIPESELNHEFTGKEWCNYQDREVEMLSYQKDEVILLPKDKAHDLLIDGLKELMWLNKITCYLMSVKLVDILGKGE